MSPTDAAATSRWITACWRWTAPGGFPVCSSCRRPTWRPEQAANRSPKDRVQLVWPVPVLGDVAVTMRCDV